LNIINHFFNFFFLFIKMSKYILPICVYDNLEITRGPQGPPGTFACPGNCFGQYIYWNGEQWVIGSSNITLGCGAGEFNQGLNAVALGENAGHTNQGDYAIAIGYQAGLTGQADNSIILNATGEPLNAGTTGFFVAPIRGFTGFNQTTLCGAGASGYKFLMYNPEDTKEVIYYDASGETLVPCADIYSQYLFWDPAFNAWKVGGSTVHLGNNAGLTNQTGCSIALGVDAGRINQNNAIAIGCTAGYSNQGLNGVAIGNEAQEFNGGTGAVAIGYQAGLTGQGQFAVAVGYQAGLTEQGDRTIVLNATGLPLGTTGTDKFYVKPVRDENINFRLLYNPTNAEVTYNSIDYMFAYFNVTQTILSGPEGVQFNSLVSNNFSAPSITNFSYNGTKSKMFRVTFVCSTGNVGSANGLSIVSAQLNKTPGGLQSTLKGSVGFTRVGGEVNTFTVTFTGIVSLNPGDQINVVFVGTGVAPSFVYGLENASLTLTEV
jgi:hypothetical protein